MGAWQCRPDQPILARLVAASPLTIRPHMSVIFQFQKTSKITFPHKKNRYKVRKNLRKFMEVGNEFGTLFILDTSSNSPQILNYSKDSMSYLI
jgi:hypothetical protein